MKLVNATLVSLEIEPGWQAIRDGVPLGKRYVLDMEQVGMAIISNSKLNRAKPIQVVWVVEPTSGFLPLSVFKIDDETVLKRNDELRNG